MRVAACKCVADMATAFARDKALQVLATNRLPSVNANTEQACTYLVAEQDIVPAVGPAVRGCCELLPVCSKDTLPLVLEIMAELLEAHCQPDYVAFVMHYVIQVCWR